MATDEEEQPPVMILHLYREPDGTFLVSEQRYYNHSVRRAHSRRRVFQDFWQHMAEQLDFLEAHASELGWHLTEQLSYLRMLREMGIIKGKNDRIEDEDNGYTG